MIEKDKIISDDKAIAETFNNHSANKTRSLGVEEGKLKLVSVRVIDDPVELAIINYSLYRSIERITENFHLIQTLQFWPCSTEEIKIHIEREIQKSISNRGHSS